MVVFSIQGTHLQRQLVADMVADMVYCADRKIYFQSRTLVLHGQEIFSALSYAKTLESAQDGGARPLRNVQT